MASKRLVMMACLVAAFSPAAAAGLAAGVLPTTLPTVNVGEECGVPTEDIKTCAEDVAKGPKAGTALSPDCCRNLTTKAECACKLRTAFKLLTKKDLQENFCVNGTGCTGA